MIIVVGPVGIVLAGALLPVLWPVLLLLLVLAGAWDRLRRWRSARRR